jgi:hypothetical protein
LPDDKNGAKPNRRPPNGQHRGTGSSEGELAEQNDEGSKT